MAKETKSRVIKGDGAQIGIHRVGNINAQVWANPVEGEDGKDGTVSHSVSLQKGFRRPGDSNWTNYRITFFPGELDAAIQCLQAAKKKMATLAESGEVTVGNTM